MRPHYPEEHPHKQKAVQPASLQEKLESMERELVSRQRYYGSQHPLTVAQRETIAAFRGAHPGLEASKQ